MSYPQIVLGIDPGMQGALALYQPQSAQDAFTYDMPTNDKGVDPCSLSVLVKHIKSLAYKHDLRAVVENVNSRPRQAGVFKFGVSVGVIHGVLAAHDIPFDLVTPVTWKGYMGLLRQGDETQDQNKDRARALATQLFPDIKDHFKRKKDDGRAEALLLAVYYANRRLK